MEEFIRLTPNPLVFHGAELGKTYTDSFTLEYIGENIVYVKIGSPKSNGFSINKGKGNHPQKLYPHHKITTNVTFTYEETSDLSTSIPITVNEEDISYDVAAVPSVFYECLPEVLDFGLVIPGRCEEKEVVLINRTMNEAAFSIDFHKNIMNLNVVPMEGLLSPREKLPINIKFLATSSGKFSQGIRIVFQNHPLVVRVYAIVIRPMYLLQHGSESKEFLFVDFKSAFFGTSQYDVVVLHNCSPVGTTFVVSKEVRDSFDTDDDAKEITEEDSATADMYQVSPMEGYLEPFEGRIITITFNPVKLPPSVGWKKAFNTEPKDYMIRLSFSQVRDYLEARAQKAEVIMLGAGVWPAVTCDPPQIDFGTVAINSSSQQVVIIRNATKLHLKYRCKRAANITMYPHCNVLKGGESARAVVNFNPHNYEEANRKIELDLLGISDVGKCKWVKVGFHEIPLIVKIPSIPHHRNPVFNPGITPMITNEVGFMVDEVGFTTDLELPRDIVITNDYDRMIKSGFKSGLTCLIAFPNDRQRSMRPWPKDLEIRTIFAQLPRHTYLDVDNTYDCQEVEMQNAMKEYWLKYIRSSEGKKQPPRRMITDYQTSGCTHGNEAGEVRREQADRESGDKRETSKKPTNMFVPLTPTQLSKVEITPTTLDFGRTPPATDKKVTLTVTNWNNFSVRATLTTTDDGIHIQGGKLKILRPNVANSFTITINTQHLGPYKSFIVITINENNTFTLLARGDVVTQVQKFEAEDLLFGRNPPDTVLGHSLRWRTVPIANDLHVPCRFTWNVPEDTPFSVQPMEVVVQPGKEIRCQVYCDVFPRCPMHARVEIRSQTGGLQFIKCKVETSDAPKVNFKQKALLYKDIALNEPVMRIAVLCNQSNQNVFFRISSSIPQESWTVEPSFGVLRAREKVNVKVICQARKVEDFQFELKFLINQSKKNLIVKVQGTVQYPKIAIEPREIIFSRVPLGSFQSQLLEAENVGAVDALLSFNFSTFLGFSTSTSNDPKAPAAKVVSVPKGSKVPLYLRFIPEEIASYNFFLPCTVNNILGPPVLGIPDSLVASAYVSVTAKSPRAKEPPKDNFLITEKLPAVAITATSARRILSFSDLECRFKKFNTDIQSDFQEVVITNVSNCELTLMIKGSEIKDTAFALRKLVVDTQDVTEEEDWEILLKTQEYATLYTNFTPPTYGTFSLDLPIFVTVNGSTILHNCLHFSGEWAEPRIKSFVSEVIFPPVPLGIETEAVIILQGVNLEQDVKLSFTVKTTEIVETAQLIGVKFPEGDVLRVAEEDIGCLAVITFKSDYPVSLSTGIVFSGDSAGKYKIQVTATADNSLITTHAFLEKHYDELSLSRFYNKAKAADYGQYIDKPPQVKANSHFQYFSFGTSTVSLSPEAEAKIVSRYPKRAKVFLEEIRKRQSLESYPFFPNGSEDNNTSTHYKRTLKSAETWLFEHGLHGSFSMKIPQDLRSLTLTGRETKTGTSNEGSVQDIDRNIYDVFLLLAGKQILPGLNVKPLPEEPAARADEAHSQMWAVLDLLKQHGALLAHVKPEFLLEYPDYVQYTTEALQMDDDFSRVEVPCGTEERTSQVSLKDSGTVGCQVLDEKSFDALSHQCWLDVVLQIFKYFYLCKINVQTFRQHKFPECTIKSRSTVFKTPGFMCDPIDSNVYGEAERILLAWLNYHFSCTRTVLWPPQATHPRDILNFTSDLSDGVVLIAVTASYCPFLTRDFFATSYPEPESFEEKFHNNVLCVQAWDAIRLGVSIQPRDICNPNSVEMVILCAFLFRNLEDYNPRETIVFSGPLSQEVARKIKLTNPVSKKVTYFHTFIGPHRRFFQVSNANPFTLAKREKSNLDIIYKARRIADCYATLILSSWLVHNASGRVMVFSLIGQVSEILPSLTMNVDAPMYYGFCKIFEIKPPYPEETTYDVWYSEEPITKDESTLARWSDLAKKKMPRRMFLVDTSCAFDAASQLITIRATFGYLRQMSRDHWILLRSPEVGEFLLQVATKPKVPRVTLLDAKAVDERLRCTCKDEESKLSGDCPLFFLLKLPMRNDKMLETFTMMFERSLDHFDLELWRKNYDSDVGIRLLKRKLENSSTITQEEFLHVCNTTVKYNIKCNPSITMPATITIANTRSRDSVTLPVHFNRSRHPDEEQDSPISKEQPKKREKVLQEFHKTVKESVKQQRKSVSKSQKAKGGTKITKRSFMRKSFRSCMLATSTEYLNAVILMSDDGKEARAYNLDWK